MKKIILTLIFCFVASFSWAFDINTTNCDDADATTWCIQTTDSSITDADCGGTCSGGDTIYIEGGARGDLEVNGLDGGGSYITITNDPTTRVVITENGDISGGALVINSSSYIDISANNKSTFSWSENCTSDDCYGIKVDASASAGSSMIATSGDCDNIKIGYVEVDATNNTYSAVSAIRVGSAALTSSVVLDMFEIHHNYVHNTTYAGLYLGNNDPPTNNDPYIANFSVHHNLMVDLGSYGMTMKGYSTDNTSSSIYNNIVRASNRASGNSTALEYSSSLSGSFAHGIAVHYLYGQTVSIYSNWIEKTYGPGIVTTINDSSGLSIYNNVILETGQCDNANSGHGISLECNSTGATVYNNTIVKPLQYGIYARTNCGTIAGDHKDNLIVDPGVDYSGGTGLTEGSGDYADTDIALTSNAGFQTWSDDSDYSNDDFNLTGSSSAVGASGSVGYPLDDYDGTSRPQGANADDGAYESTNYYIDPTCGTPGDGTSPTCSGGATDPVDQWSDLTITAGNDYRQKCGTTYTGTLTITANGTSGDYIVIGAYNADGSFEDGGNETFGNLCSGGSVKPIFDGTLANDGVTAITTPEGSNSYIEISSLKFTDRSTAIRIKGNYNKVRYCYLYNLYWGIRLGLDTGTEDGDYNTIEYNYADMNDAVDEDDLGWDVVNVGTNAQNNTIQYNRFGGYDHIGILFTGADDNIAQYNDIFSTNGHEDYGFSMGCGYTAGDDGYTSKRNIVRYNRTIDTGHGFSGSGFESGEIYGNVFGSHNTMNVAYYGAIHLYGQSSASCYIKNNKIYNNVLYDMDNDPEMSCIKTQVAVGDGTVIEDNDIFNNVCMKMSNYFLWENDPANQAARNLFANNYGYDFDLYFGKVKEGVTTNTYATDTLFNAASTYYSNNQGGNDVADDPDFYDVTTYKFWPKSGSPLIGAGCDPNDSGSACYDATYIANENILDPDNTDFTASPPSVTLETQPAAWIIGAYGESGGSAATIEQLKGIKISGGLIN